MRHVAESSGRLVIALTASPKTQDSEHALADWLLHILHSDVLIHEVVCKGSAKITIGSRAKETHCQRKERSP